MNSSGMSLLLHEATLKCRTRLFQSSYVFYKENSWVTFKLNLDSTITLYQKKKEKWCLVKFSISLSTFWRKVFEAGLPTLLCNLHSLLYWFWIIISTLVSNRCTIHKKFPFWKEKRPLDVCMNKYFFIQINCTMLSTK